MLTLRRIIPILLLFTLLVSPTSVSAQDQSTGPVYVVQSGDTLSAIAVRFGISQADLLGANNIADPNSLSLGQELVIPGLEGVQGKLVNQIVSLGENFQNFALRYQMPEDLLVRINRITSPTEVYAGTSLIVARQDNAPTLSPSTVAGDGESLLELAVLSNQNPWALEAANRLQAAWDLFPGDVLYAPSSQPEDGTDLISPLVQSITIDPLPLIQGETTTVKVHTTQPMELSGNIAGQPLNFFPDGENQYVSLIGIPAMQDTGLTEANLQGKTPGGTTLNLSQMILLAPGDFIQEVVTGVDESTLDQATNDKEIAFLATLIKSTPDKLWTGSFNYPIDEPCTASTFGNRRSYNNGSYYFYHTGQDFVVCAQNLNIYAAASGVVVFAGPLDIKGNFTVIDHGWGVYTGYAHQSEFLVKPGDRVEAGQQIGMIGTTGRSVGPHLHFEVWINGVPVNPMDWILNKYP